MANAVRKAVLELDAEQPVYSVRTMDAWVSEAMAGRRVQMGLFATFGGAALALAAIGLYGVLACSVTRRTHEIGVRMALGAQRGEVLRLIVGQGMRLVIVGLGIGWTAALALSRVLQTLLFDLKPTDPLTFAAVPVVLVTVALFACLLPAWRAAQVDPMEALRWE